jgi:hypothetical protein
VALLECLGKLLEKIIVRCLAHDIAALQLIPTTQFGACPFSSTIDAGPCLMHDVKTAHALGGVCGLLLFNLQDFFNNINHNRLTALINSLGFPPEIGKWMKFFLKNRSVHLHFNSFTFEEIDLEISDAMVWVGLVLTVFF